MRFKAGQIFQGTEDAGMRAEVIEISDDGRGASTLTFRTSGDIKPWGCL